MEITVTVCNVCADRHQETRRYEIRSEGRKAVVDLCAAHREPFETHLGSGSTKTVKAAQKATGGRRTPRKRVVTMEEIEQLKKN